MQIVRNLVVLLCAVMFAHAGDAPRKIAFSRGDAIYVANIDGTGAKKIANGYNPNISSDGRHLAFNTQLKSPGPSRYIAVADVATGEIAMFKQVPNDNSMCPVWSPDGKKLLFQTLEGHEWKLGIIDADGANFHYFEPKAKVDDNLFSVAWMPDSESFYAQDLGTLYHFALDGELKSKENLEKLFPGTSFSSGQQLCISPDGSTLVADLQIHDLTPKDTHELTSAIWTLNLSTKKAMRITPKGSGGQGPVWMDGSKILYATSSKKIPQPSIYRCSMDGKKRELLIKNADSPSVSR